MKDAVVSVALWGVVGLAVGSIFGLVIRLSEDRRRDIERDERARYYKVEKDAERRRSWTTPED